MSTQDTVDICVLRSEDRKGWVVSLCRGGSDRCQLAQFGSREEAAEFAIAERDRRRQETGEEPVIHLPDDCPCYKKL